MARAYVHPRAEGMGARAIGPIEPFVRGRADGNEPVWRRASGRDATGADGASSVVTGS